MRITSNSLNHKTIVIGAGIIGLLIAWYLTREGKRVLVIDRNIPGRESSWAGGGIISPLYPDRYPVLKPLVQRSAAAYSLLAGELYRKTGIDPELLASGLIVLDSPQDDVGLPERNGGICLSKRELANLEPLLQAPATGGLFYGDVCQVRNPRFIAALKQALANERVEFLEETVATAFQSSHGELQAVLTNKGSIEAERCVIATGAWTGDLLHRTGLWLPIRPIRGQMIVLHSPEHRIAHILVHQHRYLIPRRDGRILVGSTLEYGGYSKQGTVEAAESLRRFAGTLVPSLGQEFIEHHWTGLRPGSPDEAPFIGEHPLIKRLFICAGHYRNGFATGPASALLVVDMMLNRKEHVDSLPFRLDRPCPPWGSKLLT